MPRVLQAEHELSFHIAHVGNSVRFMVGLSTGCVQYRGTGSASIEDMISNQQPYVHQRLCFSRTGPIRSPDWCTLQLRRPSYKKQGLDCKHGTILGTGIGPLVSGRLGSCEVSSPWIRDMPRTHWRVRCCQQGPAANASGTRYRRCYSFDCCFRDGDQHTWWRLKACSDEQCYVLVASSRP